MLTPYEELDAKKPEVFRNEDLLQLNEDQMNRLLKLIFLERNHFIYRDGKWLLWIDWMDEMQFNKVAEILLKGVKGDNSTEN